MRHKRYYFISFLLALMLSPGSLLIAQTTVKKTMDHSIYEDWKSIKNIRISNNGNWVVYEVNPNRGDGILYLVNLEDRTEKTFDRGYDPRFSPESDYLVYRIRPPYALTRQAKKDEKKKDKMPKDSLGIYRMDMDLLSKVPRVKNFSIPERASSWFVLQHYYKKDTAVTDTNEYGVRLAKPEGKPSRMVVMNPVINNKHVFEKVYDYCISEKGSAIAFTQFTAIDDSIAARSLQYLDTRSGMVDEVFASDGRFGRMSLDREGTQLAFLHHPDSGRTVGLSMHYRTTKRTDAGIILDTLSEGMPEGWGISNHGKLWFSGDGSRLYFGTAPIPEPEPEDSLLPEEKYQVDVWNWQDGLLQPMQIKQLERERKRSYLAIWHRGSEGMIQLADENVESVRTMFKGDGDVGLGSGSRPYRKQISWRVNRYRDYYLINTRTGEKELILKGKAFDTRLSPGGRYILWYETADSNIYSHGVETGELACLTCGIEADFHDAEHDVPSLPGPYGIAGFTERDESVLIYSRYDIWKTDPAGKKIPINLTDRAGSGSKISFRYRHLEYDDPFIPLKKPIFLEGFSEVTKETWIYSASALLSGKPTALAEGKYSYQIYGRARDADVLCWRRQDFDEYPDVYVSDQEFREQHKISDANPQAKEYYWGSARLVHWTSYAGDELDGILYVPEDFDPSKKYPMLVYFYEKRSYRLHQHESPEPSRSTLKFAWAVSNGYVVFMPDIPYRTGFPGQSAFDAVVSGVLAMCEQFSFIDRDNMGIEGQSWGGYQVAWLVTRTRLFKAAMAGTPVSNMTSAYGGIRWGTGMSRMMQYEEGQSRIGGTLWDKTDLYLENSPIFRVPDIETPLLIMHNDNDGKVPWYQGIELFVALRRLEKPAWMLVYNDEKHSLTKWPNRVDLSIRLSQFFDHYLKGAPAPEWMYEGIPALEKGRKDGYN